MTKRLTILFFFFGCSICSLFADDEEMLRNYYNNLLPDFQHLSPEASALGKYGNYSTSGFAGVPSISIPLLNLKSGSYVMPVDLAYDASGIKVEQQATYVGLGWNLVLGGTISQIVCGKNDFSENTYASIKNSDLLNDMWPEINYISSPLASLRSVRYPIIPTVGKVTVFPAEEDRRKSDILRSVSDGLEIPDIFQASFCGHSLSFVIRNSKNADKDVMIIGTDATKYTVELKEYSDTYPLVIEITDDHGQKYIFTEAPLTSMYDNASYTLSEIRNAAGRCLMKFKYSIVPYKILHPYYETQGKRDESYDMPIASEAIQRQFIDRNYPSTLGGFTRTYCPDTILTDREIVTFAYGNREDIKGAKRMEQILVKSRTDNSLIHTVDFQYGNFTEKNTNSDIYRYGYFTYYGNNRLKLSGITVDGRTYSFGYNEDGQLPSRLSVSQDFWGYYNGQNNYDGFCASPEFKYNDNGVLSGLETVGPANRYASESYSEIGTLNKITYPTGGYTRFYYEINHFDDTFGKFYYPSADSSSDVKHVKVESCGSGYTGSGYKSTADSVEFDISEPVKVEIESSSPCYPDQYYKLYLSIEGKDSIGQTVFSQSWIQYNDKPNFKESYTLPKGHYVLTSQFGNVASGLIVGGGIKVYFPPEYDEVHSIADASGKSVGGGLRVKTIESYDNDNNLLEYTRYRYEGGKLLIPTVQKEQIPMAYLFAVQPAVSSLFVVPSTLVSKFFFVTSNPTYPAICSLGSPNVGYSKITKERYNQAGQLMSYETEKYGNEGYRAFGENNYFNMFSVNLNGLNGKLMESAIFSEDSIPMLKKEYSYTTFGNNPAMEDMVFFPWARCLNLNPGSSALSVDYKYSLYPKYPIEVLPSSMTETHYVNGSPMQPIVTSYSYKASNFQPTEITRTSPTNDVTSTKYWYPDDSLVSSSNTQCLTDAHCISEKVKALEVRNGNTVGGYRNYYGVSNDLPVVIQNFSIASDGSERSELHVTKYDEYGNICEYTKNDGTPVTIIWSYNHQCPVLEIIGDTYEHVKNMSTSVSALENMVEVPAGLIASTHSSLANNNLMVTAYEYSPWLTVSRIISPNGYAVDYSYDDYGRLERKNDADGVIQKYEYNYKH